MPGLHRFLKLLIKRRLSRYFDNEYEGEPLNQLLRQSTKAWHGVRLHQPDWSPSSHSVAVSAEIVNERHCVHWILNVYREPLDFELPKAGPHLHGRTPPSSRVTLTKLALARLLSFMRPCPHPQTPNNLTSNQLLSK
jgi:hypothetical protein